MTKSLLCTTITLAATLMLAVASSPSFGAARWGYVGEFTPGMSKEAARKAGIQNCEARDGKVTCSPIVVKPVGGVLPSKTELVFDERKGFLKQIRVYFEGVKVNSPLDGALEAELGKPTNIDDASPCSGELGKEYDNHGDVTVHSCEASQYGKAVYYRFTAGRGAQIRKNAALAASTKAKASSFNTKP